MNFDLTDERQMLQDSLRKYLADHYSNEVIRALAKSDCGYSKENWAGLAELGVVGALFSEEDGGYGGAGFDMALVFEELGRVGATDPLVDTAVLCGGILAALGHGEQKNLVESIIEGSLQMALAHAEPQSRYELSRVDTRVEREGEDFVLNGQKCVVVNASAADYLIVSARSEGAVAATAGISLFLVPTDTAGLTLNDYPLSAGGRAAEVQLDNVRLGAASLLGKQGDAFDTLELVHARATVAVCAEALGLMETIRALTTDYLKVRKQFGRPIGKFQVLQHRMADILIEIEQARSAVINLAGHVDGERDAREKHVSATKNLIGLVGKLVAEESIQMHGGIGMTEEYELGHLAKRLIMVDHRLGDATFHLERFVELAVA
ncbi:acyl-CoA dehydrogenase family protein [Granulosicoccus antarcticus]|uniref:Acyl-CoA dehydrogenase fadE12 n=1 Tax=Granulosicoccus antarcticus IMCC3135 TaxID=1192854 RepID=A0A2Z2NWE2_9GAMM|nr:acyl-CoA dehydrogenase [Granulosicoccus antarcticus]ASJ73140.1 Acyl-CoA dehydrogenase fadE12 [Granulosicoccus antarcticus IMCC3135]